MEFDSFKSHVGDVSFAFDSLVETNGFQNLHDLYYDYNDQFLANTPSYCSSVLDGIMQPHSINAGLLPLGDVNAGNNVGVAIGGFRQQMVDMSICNSDQQKAIEDSDCYMIDHVDDDKKSPRLSTCVTRSIEPLKSFSSPKNVSNLAAEGTKLVCDQGPTMNSKCTQMKKNGDKTANRKINVVKGQWTLEEDKLLVGLVEKYGVRRWSHIAQMLTGRVGKQCRERWHNHLRPNIKKDTWTEEEDKVLIQAHSEIGNKWAEIAKRLPGRTENSIKNHWNATKRRQFSRRRCCRSSKYFKSGSLLQNYIKSLTSTLTTAPTSMLSFDNQKSTTAGNKEEWKGVLSMPLKSITGTYEVPACGGPDLGIEKRNVDEGIYDVGHLFDRLGFGAMASGGSSSSEGNGDFETAMNWDLMLPPPSENVKREMDLVEMIFENNSF